MGALIQQRSIVVGVDEQLQHLIEWLRQCPDAQVRTFEGRIVTRSDIVDCDAVFVRSVTRVNESLLGLTNVRFVGSATSGRDHLDEAFLRRNNIVVATAHGMNAPTVAQYVLYVLLRWVQQYEVPLSNAVLGVVGYGAIGRIVAWLGQQLGMRVLINDPPLEEEHFPFPAAYEVVPLQELLSRSDVVTLHVPLTRDGRHPTLGLIGVEELTRLKSHSLLINTSRGGVVDEIALLLHLQSGAPLATAVDVWEGEPLPNIDLVQAVWFPTPHVAGYSVEAGLRIQYRLLEIFFKMFGECTEAMRAADRAITTLLQSSEIMPFSADHQSVLLEHLDRVRPLGRIAEQFRGCATSLSLIHI